MEFLDFLNGASPWWWIAFALALGALEMATMSFFLIWPALAALCVAAMLGASPDLSAASQISIFAVMSIILTFIGRHLVMKYGDGGGAENETLNKRGARFIGRNAKVLEYSDGQGVVEIDGMRWRANWQEDANSSEGTNVRVIEADGLTLTVTPS